MIEFLTRYKPITDQQLRTFLQKKKHDLSKVNSWGIDAIERLSDFVVRGKSIRASLVIFSYKMLRDDLPKEVIETAAALELFHCGFLIHDDIADQDLKRRGVDAIHHQYQKLTGDKHKGISMAIHAADLAFFLGFELTGTAVKSLIAREFANVCAAQMDDIAGTKDKQKLYLYKTARYTFSLPLAVGATLAEAKTSIIQQLEDLGETLGLLYQIRDDQLDHEKTISAQPFYERAKFQISALPVNGKSKKALLELARFCVERTS